MIVLPSVPAPPAERAARPTGWRSARRGRGTRSGWAPEASGQCGDAAASTTCCGTLLTQWTYSDSALATAIAIPEVGARAAAPRRLRRAHAASQATPAVYARRPSISRPHYGDKSRPRYGLATPPSKNQDLAPPSWPYYAMNPAKLWWESHTAASTFSPRQPVGNHLRKTELYG